MWNNEKMLSSIMILVGGLSVYGALKLPLKEEFTLGPGATPLIYAVGVIVFAAAMAFTASSKNTGSFRKMIEPPGRYGLLFFAFFVLLTVLVYFIGFTIGLFLFSLFSLVFAKNHKPLWAAVFSAVWTASLYLIFVRLLNIPFLKGTLFGGS